MTILKRIFCTRLSQLLSLATLELLIIKLAFLPEFACISAAEEVVLEQDVADGAVVRGVVADYLSYAFAMNHVVVNNGDAERSVNPWHIRIASIPIAEH